MENLPKRFYEKPDPRFDLVQRVEHAEEFFQDAGADIRQGGHRAYYVSSDEKRLQVLLDLTFQLETMILTCPWARKIFTIRKINLYKLVIPLLIIRYGILTVL